ncbi:ubiquitin activating enzyme, putative, partial [Plasmodium ovale curtisi]
IELLFVCNKFVSDIPFESTSSVIFEAFSDSRAISISFSPLSLFSLRLEALFFGGEYKIMNMTIFFKYIFLVFIYFFVQIKPNNKSNIYALNYNTNKTSRTFSIYFPKYSIKKCHHKNTEKRGNRFQNLHKLCNLSVINKKVQNGTNLSLHTPLNKNGDQTQKENKKASKQESKQENGEEDEINEMGINVLEKEKKYSRQIYTHGYNEEKKIRKSKILIIGLNGVSSEICKNLIICGVNEIGIYDNDILTFEDIDNLFFCDNNLINKEKKSLACLQNLKKLNNNCKIKAITNNLFDNLNDLNIYDIVVSVNQKEQFNIKLNNICRLKKKKFIAVNTVGIYGRMFVDFGDFIFSNGVNNEKYVINKIEFKDEDIIMHYLSNYENIHLSENDMVDLCASGLNKTLNIQCKIKNISKKENKITVSVCNGFNKYIQFLNWIFNNNFMKILSKILTYLNIYFLYNIRKQIEKKKVDNIKKKYNKYKINNNVSIRKMHEQVRLNYVTLEDYLNIIKKKIKNNQIILINMFYKLLNLVLNNKKGNANDLTDEEVCFLCYDEIVRDKKGYVGIRCNLTSDDLERFKTLCLKKKKNMNVQVINDFLSAAHIELPPFS